MWVVQGSRQAQILQEEAVRQMEIRRRMRAEVVPTQDGDVRRMLRQLEHPITLFGEREVRFLRQLLSQRFYWTSGLCCCTADGEESSAEEDTGRDGFG